MHLDFTPYVLPVILSAVVSAAVARYTWLRRPTPGATSFCLLTLAVVEWSLGYALELVSPGLPTALFWDNVTWTGAVCVPVLWLVFVLQYTGRVGWLTRRSIALLAVEPLVTLVLVWTNQFHGLIQSNIRWDSTHLFSALVMTYGTWYWINLAISYLLLFIGTILLCMLIQTPERSGHLYLGQAGALLLAVLVPWVGNALTSFELNPLSPLDLTPFAFTISGLLVAWSLFRFRLLDIIPVAREVVFENMGDAVIVVDEQNRIVDINPAAQQLVHCTASSAIGQPFTRIFSSWPELIEHCCDVTDTNAQIVLDEGESLRYIDLRISHLSRRSGHHSIAGRLIVLNDITEYMQAERSLRESEERFRNIFEKAPIGMAVIDLDHTLMQVNKAFCEMLGYCEQELIGCSLSVITHPDDAGKDGFLALQLLKGAIPSYKVEKRYLRKDHKTLCADLTTTLLRNQDGQAICGLMMLENIIERKRAKLLEEERYHVAYEVHDGLAQVAASAHQHLQAFAGHYHPRSPQARQELGRALELAQLSVREARWLISGLHPTALDDFGLATALRLLVEALGTEGWTISYEETLGSERLPTIIETTLFGVAKEALANARKHARTTRVRVALDLQASKIRLEVQDWGCGFEPLAVLHEARLGEHLGLREMQARVELVGGNLNISSQSNVGTLVVAEVLLQPSDERSM